jgi:exodeoxyribonuclease V alpha subunit
MPESDPEKIVARIRELVTQRIPERFGLDARNDVQVLSPMHKGLTGAQNLNRMLQQALNPNGEELSFGDKHFRVGDRVMQIKNDYDKDVFNGDMGEIAGWDAEEGELEVRFDGRPVKYPRKDLDQLMLSYTITVHKAQGSEYPAVVLPFTTHHAIMLQRNLLYTAITRGRRLVVLIGTEKAVSMAVANARRDPRYTCLRQRLVEGVFRPSPARSLSKKVDTGEVAPHTPAPSTEGDVGEEPYSAYPARRSPSRPAHRNDAGGKRGEGFVGSSHPSPRGDEKS